MTSELRAVAWKSAAALAAASTVLDARGESGRATCVLDVLSR